jgi:hypothetical protein
MDFQYLTHKRIRKARNFTCFSRMFHVIFTVGFSSRYAFMFYVIVFIVVVGIIIHSLFFAERAVMKSTLKKITKVGIADFEEGSVGRISGTFFYGGKIIQAHLSYRLYSYFHILVERNMGGKNSKLGTFVEEKLSGDVIIKDGGFYTLVQIGTMMNTYILPDNHYTSGVFT